MSYKIYKSALFQRQIKTYASYYKDQANVATALKFLDAIEKAIEFIGEKPLACSVYEQAVQDKDLSSTTYRKWSLKKFQFSIFFHIENQTDIFLDVIYAHKMDIRQRLKSDMQT